jgi:SAM-dependent methyltransferase
VASSTPFDRWADAYDRMDRDSRPFIDFYTSLVTPRTRSVLELGCGTGTILEPLVEAIARHGPPQRVIGLDESERMLSIARERVGGVELVRGDMRDPPITGAFDLIVCCFNTLQLLPREEDVAQTFRAVRSRLRLDGVFAFDVYRPDLAYLHRGHTGRLAKVARDERGRRLETREDARYDPRRRMLTLDWRLVAPDDPSAHTLAETRFEIRQYFPEDLERLLEEANLEMRHRYGDLDRAPFAADSKRQVVVCRPAAD